ncbi:Uncharacterised protein [Yersinia frederiksenii]|uniref:Uncharacterized protein n=1 Tax=Yersinia rochesterensis TaxID=1604335 RepID=A0A8D4SPS1_9GAMM|nr:hypothetical protein DXZ79_19680 [Yersinia rochesterensis]CFR29133.1 Uncharacterised protein [Yersinia frederiksenii]
MKKLKQQYKYSEEFSGVRRSWVHYPLLRNWLYKRFSTRQEKSHYYLHSIEYKEYPLKLRAARGKQLANPWDDYPSDVYHIARNWKHNSRRRRQYYR